MAHAKKLEISAMPAITNAPRENIIVQPINLFGGHLAAGDRSAHAIAMTSHPTISHLPTKLTKTLRVLVVEDDAMIGVLLGEMLEGMGYDVCGIEATEADAVAAAARCKPDLMIVDVQLGEGSGVSAIDTIQCARPVPHVFVGGNIAGIRVLRPDSIFIQKPYRESELAMGIQRALESDLRS
jgi:CheY-like chemotaxis protein